MHYLKMVHTTSEDLIGHMIACVHIFNFPRGWMLFEKTEKIWLFRRGSELQLDLHYHQEDPHTEQCPKTADYVSITQFFAIFLSFF